MKVITGLKKLSKTITAQMIGHLGIEKPGAFLELFFFKIDIGGDFS